MRKFFAGFIFILLLVPVSASAQTPNEQVREIWNEGAAAYNNDDMHGFLVAMQALEQLRPHQLPMLYNVAAGFALTGQIDEAMTKLEAIAVSGLYVDVEADDDFSAIANHARYDGLLQSMDALIAETGLSQMVREIDMLGLLPEGVAQDEVTGTLFVSTVQGGEIWRVSTSGETSLFVANDAHAGLGGLFGMAVDNARGLVWVASATPDQYSGANRAGNPLSAVFGISLSSGEIEHYLPLEGDDRFLGEIVIAPDGGVYASDSISPAIYRVSDDLSGLEMVYANDQMRSFQGFDFDDQGRIFVADYVHGIFRIDAAAHELARLEVTNGANLSGIDGLYFYDGSLIVIRNGVPPNRIVRHFLSADGLTIVRSDVLVNNHVLWNEPTLGQVVGDQLIYNAASGWPDFTADGEIREGANLRPIRIMSVDLN